MRRLFYKVVFGKWWLVPWWEQLRRLVLLISLVLDVFLVGVKVISNESLKQEYWKGRCPRAAYTFHVGDWSVYFAVTNMIVVLLAIGADVIWRQIPSVRKTFETLLRYNKAIDELKLTEDEIKDIVNRIISEETQINPHATKDVERALKGMCYDLWTTGRNWKIPIRLSYISLNIICGLPTAMSIWYLPYIWSEDDIDYSIELEDERASSISCVDLFDYEMYFTVLLMQIQPVLVLLNVAAVISASVYYLRCVHCHRIHFAATLANGIQACAYIITTVFMIVNCDYSTPGNLQSRFCVHNLVLRIFSLLSVATMICWEILCGPLYQGQFKLLALIFSILAKTFTELYFIAKFNDYVADISVIGIAIILVTHLVVTGLLMKVLLPSECSNIVLSQTMKMVLSKECDNNLALTFIKSRHRAVTKAILFPSKLGHKEELVDAFLSAPAFQQQYYGDAMV